MRTLIFASRVDAAKRFANEIRLIPGQWTPITSIHNVMGLSHGIIFVLDDTFSTFPELKSVDRDRMNAIHDWIQGLADTQPLVQVVHASLDKAVGVIRE